MRNSAQEWFPTVVYHFTDWIPGGESNVSRT